jgi:hypothetical protein
VRNKTQSSALSFDSIIVLMFHLIVYFLFIVVFNDVYHVAGWNPAKFSFNPGDNYELV